MKRLLLVSVLLLLATMASSPSMAGDIPGTYTVSGMNGLPPFIYKGGACDPYVDYDCEPDKAALRAAGRSGYCDPYVNYKCLDAYLGQDFVTRFFRYYQLEWGKAVAPSDPTAPPSRRSDSVWPPTPQSTPPMPFTEWPYGGTTAIAVTRPNSIDSPLMAALGNTQLGQWMNSAHIQVYGWLNVGGNVSSNTVKAGGNAPAAYDYTPNTVQLDQAVVYIERLPDEVQKDHFDWGFRISGLYGENYRYTTAYGVFSQQLLNQNLINGYDFPMVYADLYFPFMEGLNVRIGRFISVPDIEAQLAPNNYTYVHSMTYSFDNYTNQGIQFTQAVTKNWILQLGTSIGSDTAFWHWNQHVPNLYVQSGSNAAGFGPGVDPLYPDANILKDPGAVPSVTAGVRWTSDDGKDDLNIVADAINGGQWGYNNLQWYGLTYYHKFNDFWHIAFETYNLHQNSVPNLNNPQAVALVANGGSWNSPNLMPFNSPNLAACANAAALTCTASAQSFLLYVNYSPDKLNNFSLRTEWYDDEQGQRTGTATRYTDVALSWQHWFSPQIEMRPEVAYYRSLDAPAFNGNVNEGIAPSRNYAVIGAADLIVHF
jgi:Putative beta-barrel porin-2, OmpL-like. bbp2